jgi:hypothetical protein
MACDLYVSPIFPYRTTLCPVFPSLQWIPGITVPHLIRPERGRSLRWSATTASRSSRALHFSFALRYPAYQETVGSPEPALNFPQGSRVASVKTCPALRPRWFPRHSHYRTVECCLPLAENVSFGDAMICALSIDHDYTFFGVQ